MPIQCPFCGHRMNVRDAKPGRYQPKCGKCSERFVLTIPDGGGEPIVGPAGKPSSQTVAEGRSAERSVSESAKTKPDQDDLAKRSVASPMTTRGAADATLPPETSRSPASPTSRAARSIDETFDRATHSAASGRASSPADPAATFDAGTTRVPTGEARSSESDLSTHRSSNQTRGGGDATMIHEPPSGSNASSRASAGASAGVSPTSGKTAVNTAATGGPGAVPRGASSSAGPTFDRLGGYRVVRELGRGAMGTVYLARQLSLDRQVALKTIQAHWTGHPSVMARFTREAYAAAQLTHHNVVQIYDLGEDRGTPFFSMEFVRGSSLDDLLRREGKIEPRRAVGYTLQAARGLRFAHQHGMVHRDIKPANLMLDEHGVVKVADLGLVKTPEMLELDEDGEVDSGDAPSRPSRPATESALASSTASVTMMNSALGTPAFMAPEQAENAAGVDHRADIYSLGCTLYALLTGRPPFDGATALEVMSKHRTQPAPRIEAIDESLPNKLSDIVMRMVAKNPDDRFSSLDDLIVELEGFLNEGGESKLRFTEEHAQTLESCAVEFNRVPAARLHSLLALGFAAACLGLGLVVTPFSFAWGSAFFVMLAAAALTYFTVGGIRERTHLFDKAREFLFAARWTDWAVWLFGGALIVVIAMALGWLVAWIAGAVLGVGAGLAMNFIVDGMIRTGRRPAIERVESMLKSLRLQGIDEAELRRFCAEFGGDHWEPLFESLFGYEAKLSARESLPAGRRRRRYRAWREPVVRWFDSRVQAHRAARERAHLMKVEQAGLKARGVDEATARRQAEQMASAMVDDAAQQRRAAAIANRMASSASASAAGLSPAAAAAVDPKAAADAKRARQKAMLAEARSGKYSKKNTLPFVMRGPFGFLLSGKVRFLLGCLLLAGCVLWVKQNQMLSTERVKAAAAEAIDNRNLSSVTANVSDVASQVTASAGEDSVQPLKFPVVGPLFDSFNPGIAGLMLIGLSLFRGGRMSVFALPAAAVIVLGPTLGLPGIAALGGPYTTSVLIGLALGAAGLLLGRSPVSEQ